MHYVGDSRRETRFVAGARLATVPEVENLQLPAENGSTKPRLSLSASEVLCRLYVGARNL
jgi:hypothetical protein